MKILVVGWYGHRNVGDESYTLTLPRLFPQHELRFVDHIAPGVGEDCDAVFVGGGNVMKAGFLDQLAPLYHKPIYGISVGVESDFKPGVPFKHVFARENFSVATLNAAGVSASLMPDVAMTMTPDPAAGQRWLRDTFAENRLDLYKKVIVVVVNAYMMSGECGGLAKNALHFMDFSYRMAKVADDTAASFVFLPFGTAFPHDDRVANSWVAAKCKYWPKNLCCFDRLGVQETLDVISAADLVISSRLHSSVFAFTSGVPFIDITHHSKNDNFLSLIGRQDAKISFWDFDATELQRKINRGLTLSRDNDVQAFRKLIQEEVNAVRFD